MEQPCARPHHAGPCNISNGRDEELWLELPMRSQTCRILPILIALILAQGCQTICRQNQHFSTGVQTEENAGSQCLIQKWLLLCPTFPTPNTTERFSLERLPGACQQQLLQQTQAAGSRGESRGWAVKVEVSGKLHSLEMGGEDKHLLTLLVQLLNQFLIAWKAVLILFDYILLSPSELQHLNVVLIKAILENKTPLEYMRINTVYRPRWLKRYCYGLLCKYIFTRAFEIQIMQIRIQGLLKMQIIDLTDHKGSFETILGYSIM